MEAPQAPAAQGVRVGWDAVPWPVRSAIEEICGAPVVRAESQPGGFSPGVAARALCADGTRWFIKAVSAEANPDSPAMHRREAEILRALDALIAAGDLPAPRLRGTADIAPWTALVLEDIEGRQPGVPWKPDELATILAALDLLIDALTPAPVPLAGIAETHGELFSGWRILAGGPGDDRLDPWFRRNLDRLADLERDWAAHASGDTLVHADIRADNLLLTAERVVVVDWPHACLGSAFLDVALFAPSVAMQGGPSPAELVTRTRAGRGADSAALVAMVCAIAGFLTERSLRPSPQGLPTLRAFQAAQATIARDWLAGLLRASG
jgi:aminoglycoside phosphotransferase (APT) family kinase protein